MTDRPVTEFLKAILRQAKRELSREQWNDFVEELEIGGEPHPNLRKSEAPNKP